MWNCEFQEGLKLNTAAKKNFATKQGRSSGSTEVRVRFAPSPTGELHVGGARTALYNWLFARHHGGRFILRIEDTDRSRSTDEAIETIISSLNWLGLDWDEGPGVGGDHGPYRQTERLELYQRWAEKLLVSGQAYYCYCLPEELAERRRQAQQQGCSPQYDRRCRKLSETERRQAELKNPQPVLRFAAPLEGQTEVDDLIRGKIAFQHSDVDDFIILRSDRTPTYNFAAVIDDALMKISQVLRGDDHLSNTPKQLLLYQALGFPAPEFGHLAMILGPDKKPLSKRFGSTSVETYHRQGYLPEALLNYLALLGWSYDEKTTFFSLSELVEKFTLEKVSKKPAVFDPVKLEWMNGHYLRQLPVSELAEKLVPGLLQSGMIDDPACLDRKHLERIALICQERIKTLSEFPTLAGFFFREEIDYDQEAAAKVGALEYSRKILKEARKQLALLEDFDNIRIEQVLRRICQEKKINPSKGLQPVRLAVTGKLVSPPLFESIELLGKEKTLRRLEKAILILEHK